MMYRAKCAAITALASTTAFLRVTAVQAFLNAPFADPETTSAKQNRAAIVRWTKRIATNAGPVGCASVSESA